MRNASRITLSFHLIKHFLHIAHTAHTSRTLQHVLLLQEPAGAADDLREGDAHAAQLLLRLHHHAHLVQIGLGWWLNQMKWFQNTW